MVKYVIKTLIYSLGPPAPSTHIWVNCPTFTGFFLRLPKMSIVRIMMILCGDDDDDDDGGNM